MAGGEDWNKDSLVFCGARSQPLSPDDIWRTFHMLLKQAGLPPTRVQALRHTFATLPFQKDRNVKDVSAMLEHSKVATTYDIYAHVIHEDQAERRGHVDPRSAYTYLGREGGLIHRYHRAVCPCSPGPQST